MGFIATRNVSFGLYKSILTLNSDDSLAHSLEVNP